MGDFVPNLYKTASIKRCESRSSRHASPQDQEVGQNIALFIQCSRILEDPVIHQERTFQQGTIRLPVWLGIGFNPSVFPAPSNVFHLSLCAREGRSLLLSTRKS